MPNGSGSEFQADTKYIRGEILGGGRDWGSRPSVYKEYPSSKKIKLPAPEPLGNPVLVDVLRRRRSIRSFSAETVNMEQLSYLLWAATGVQRKERGFKFRTAPSAGALYPIETYIVANKVKNLAKGVYHYSVKFHLLEEVKLGDLRNEVTKAALGQEMCAQAAVVFVWTAIFARSGWKYKQRAYRYIYLDVGHIAQNLALASTGLGLGSCQVGAFFDDEINEVVEVDGVNESVVYLSVVGYPR